MLEEGKDRRQMMINYTPVQNIYPGMGTETLGQMATGFDPGPAAAAVEAGGQLDGALNGEVVRALTIGGQANPVVGFLLFGAIATGLMLLTHYMTPEERPGSIKASAINALIISLWAIAGIPVWKWLFTRFPVPGISAWVHAV
jgi:hypothetical protein